MTKPVSIKICGLTNVRDAEECVEAGADALGLCFWEGSKRCVSVEQATQIVRAIGARVQVVAVVVDLAELELRELLDQTGIRWAQLHGREPPDLLDRFLPHAYKALGVKDAGIAQQARRFGGEHLLLDAAMPGLPGGTGHSFDWRLVTEIARCRMLTLAGGLTAENVGEAIRVVHPYRVDVASGVERAPGLKDPEKVQAFVRAVRDAAPGPAALPGD